MRGLTSTLPIIAMIAVLFGVAHAEAPSNVEVTQFPFETTILEGGSVTFTNPTNDRMDINLSGWFTESVYPNESITIEFPVSVYGNEGSFFIRELVSGQTGWLHIEAIYVAPPPEPVVEEQITVEETIAVEGIYDVELVDDIDVVELNNKFLSVTTDFNNSLITIAEQRDQIDALSSTVLSLEEQVNSLSYLNATNTQVDTLELEVTYLESQIVGLNDKVLSVELEKDKWKQLANSWYTVAMEQLRVMVNVLGL